eukprot:5133830-Karenia_brevis.AAC.1
MIKHAGGCAQGTPDVHRHTNSPRIPKIFIPRAPPGTSQGTLFCGVPWRCPGGALGCPGGCPE